MRLKDLFTVPTGQKTTEKHLHRVLFSSICSILLCMSCLVGTTWAWFKVSVENENNMIQIGEPNVIVKVNNEVFESGSALPSGESVVTIAHGNEPDDLNKKSTLYVTLTIRDSEAIENDSQNMVCVYTTLDQNNGYSAEVQIRREAGMMLAEGEGEAVQTEAESRYMLSWEVSWFAPVNAIELIDGPIILTDREAAEETIEPTESSECTESSESTESSEATESTESTDPTDNDESTESTESTDSSGSTEDSESTEPSGSTESAESTEPSESTESDDSTDSFDSTESTGSAESAESTENTESTNSSEPAPGATESATEQPITPTETTSESTIAESGGSAESAETVAVE